MTQKKKPERTEAEKQWHAIKRSYTTEELDALYLDAKQNIIGRYAVDLAMMPAQKKKDVIEAWNMGTKMGDKGRGNQIPGRFGKEIKSEKDILSYCNWWIDFYHQIKTQEQFEEQYVRMEKLLYADYQIALPIVVKFDYQINGILSFINPPTFYSYWDDDILTQNGKGSCVIAFCSFTPILTDEELMAVIKHEFGHIVQGHCVTGNIFTPREQEYINQAMDVSINVAFTDQDKDNLISAASKMWGEGATGCMSLAGKKDKGGYALKGRFVSPGDWPSVLSELKYAFEPKEKKEGEGEGEGQGQGQGGGGGGGDTLKVGDYIVTRKSPVKHGKVVYIDPQSGKTDVEEYTDAEWEQIRKTLKPTE